MKIRHYFCLLLYSATVTACSSLPSSALDKDQYRAVKSGLPAQTLSAGECGLFVWAFNQTLEFILFSSAAKREAIWDADEGEQVLSISQQSGVPTQGQFPKQSYEPVDLSLDLRLAQTIEHGTRYRGGTLKLKSEGEWDKVIPVVGLSVCQPNN